MKITRNVIELIEDKNEIYYTLNGHNIWVGKNTKQAGIPGWRGYQFRYYDLCLAIAHNKPGVTIDLKDQKIIDFLKETECLK